jgi:hypothetical protein
MMLLIDASKHRWLGPDLPPCHLLATVDDATNEVFAIFRQEEDTVGYTLLLKRILKARGVPLTLYSDRRTLFGRPHADCDDESASETDTHFARIRRELGIEPIFARTPQAKGRIERAFETLQDRLTVELALTGARSIEDANRALPALLKRHNQRFQVNPESPDSAFRASPLPDRLRYVLALRFPRVVANDNTVSFGGRRLAIPGPNLPSYSRKTIEVLVEPNGRISFWHQGTLIAEGPSVKPPVSVEPSAIVAELPLPAKQPPSPKPRRQRREPVIVKPAPDHPWRLAAARPRKQPAVECHQPVGG